jgi:hypothetical protein
VIDVATLRGWLGSPESDDDLLEELEREAVAQVESYTGHYYGPPAARVDYLDGSGGAVLWLPAAGTSLSIGTVEELAYMGADAVALTGYESRGSRLIRTDGYPWVLGYSYRVTYTAGYAEDTEPAMVRQVVRQLVSLAYQERGTEGLQSETIGDYSYTRTYGTGGGGLTAADQIMAKLPRRIRV